jgi:hypothetical protein
MTYKKIRIWILANSSRVKFLLKISPPGNYWKFSQQKIHPPLPTRKMYAYFPITNQTKSDFYNLKTSPQGL